MANKSSAGESLGGCALIVAIIVGVILYAGAHHGWDRHSFFVTVPFWSGPSESEMREKLRESGWINIEEIDRRPAIESAGDHKTRRGTQLYPVRIKLKTLDANTTSMTADFYFYRDDFGELCWFTANSE